MAMGQRHQSSDVDPDATDRYLDWLAQCRLVGTAEGPSRTFLLNLKMRACDDSDSHSSDSSSGSSTSTGLIKRVQQRDQAAWERLVRVYTKLVFHWCKKANLSPADSEDVSQNVFMAVAQGIGGFHKQKPGDTFRGWLRTIARNKIIDHWRKISRQPLALGGSEGQQLMENACCPLSHLDDPTEEDQLSEQAVIVRAALEEIRPRFSEKNWRAFWEAEIEGRPRREIAEELGEELGTINQAIYRIRRRLREVLGELPE